jgi:hypothetical protein
MGKNKQNKETTREREAKIMQTIGKESMGRSPR